MDAFGGGAGAPGPGGPGGGINLQELPAEMIQHILSFTSMGNLGTVSQVSQQLRVHALDRMENVLSRAVENEHRKTIRRVLELDRGPVDNKGQTLCEPLTVNKMVAFLSLVAPRNMQLDGDKNDQRYCRQCILFALLFFFRSTTRHEDKAMARALMEDVSRAIKFDTGKFRAAWREIIHEAHEYGFPFPQVFFAVSVVSLSFALMFYFGLSL
jgi:hypothetical protein